MHPDALANLIMAARGHANLPPTATFPGSPSGGPAAAPMPSAAPAPGGQADRQIVSHASQQLMAAMAQVHDPALKASFSTALAALHKWLAQDDKEHQQALAGKLSPKLMARAHGAA